MEDIRKLDGSKCSNYPNALHAEFHERMYAAVLAASPTKFNIAEAMLNGYKQHIDEEIDLNKAAQKSVHSQTLAQADSLRDADLSVLIGTVDINRLSPDAAKRDAAIALAVVLDPYRKIANEGTEAETLHVKGLLVDMAKAENAARQEKLGLKEVINDLKKYNDLFVAATADRDSEKVTRAQSKSKLVRPLTDNDYAQICTLLQASLLMTTKAEDVAAGNALIDAMNVITADLKARWKASVTASRTSQRAKDEEAAKALGITYDEYIASKKAGTLPKEEKKPSKPRTPSERPADLLDSSSGGDTGGGDSGGGGGTGGDEKPGGL